MTSNLYIGVDLGTSGCRAIAIDGNKKIQGEFSTPLPMPTGENSHREQQPDVWWQAVSTTLSRLLCQLPCEQVRSIAIDGTSATLLLTDATGEPLGPALMYNDARSTQEAEQIASLAPRESAAHGATSALAKLRHLTPNPQARFALHQADWIGAKLSGCLGISDSNNALKMGYDPIAKRWPDWLQKLNIDTTLLPEVRTPGTPIGPLTTEMQRQFGLTAEVELIAGTTDSTAAFIATAANQPGEAVTSLGSTLVVKVVATEPIFSPAHGVYSQPLGDLWLVGGSSNSGGAVLRHHFSDAEIATMTTQLRPDTPTGLDYYPLIQAGERFPINDPELAPRLTPHTTDNLTRFQGMLEGIAMIEKQGYQQLHALGAPYPSSIRSVGGGANNQAWCQIRRQLLGVPLVEPQHQEAAYGAALLAHQGAQQTEAIPCH